MTSRTFIYKDAEDEDYDNDNDKAYLVAVLVDFFEELFFGLDAGYFGEVVSDGGKYGIPYACSQCGEEDEGAELHAGKSGRDGDELAHGRDEPADEGGNGTVLVEEFFGMLYLGLVDEAHVSESAIGELVDNGTAEPLGKEIVDECSYIGSKGGKEYDQIDVQASVTSGGFPCGRGNHHFRGEGDK